MIFSLKKEAQSYAEVIEQIANVIGQEDCRYLCLAGDVENALLTARKEAQSYKEIVDAVRVAVIEDVAKIVGADK